jgi:hypothetical protein
MPKDLLTKKQKNPYQKPKVQQVPLEPAEALNQCCKNPPGLGGCSPSSRPAYS